MIKRISRFFPTARRNLLFSITASVTLFGTLVQAQSVQISADFSKKTDKIATGKHYGLNQFQGFDPNIVNLPEYRNALNTMRPGMVRYHSLGEGGPMTSSPNGVGWVINQLNIFMMNTTSIGVEMILNNKEL